MTSQKEYPQGYGCIPGTFGYFECILTDDALNRLSPLQPPVESKNLIETLVNHHGKKLFGQYSMQDDKPSKKRKK